MKSDWTIRPAQESDVDVLMKMHLALQEYHEGINPNIWRMSVECRGILKDQINQCLYDQDSCVFVAADSNNEVIGMATGNIEFSRFRIPSTIAHIEDVYVHENWRGNGIGSELVKRICKFFASRYIKDVSIKYVAGNQEAIGFWQKLGFAPRIITAGTELRNLEAKIIEK